MLSKNSFQASRYVRYFLLLTDEELKAFLPEGCYVILGKVLEDPVISKERLITLSQAGRIPPIGFAFSKDHFTFMTIPNRGVIAKEKLPMIEIKPFAFMVSSDGKLLENVFGKGSIEFGLCFSYPTLFSDGGEVVKTKDIFFEGKVFSKMRAFVRKKTTPCKLTFRGDLLNASFRMGNMAGECAIEKIKNVDDLELL